LENSRQKVKRKPNNPFHFQLLIAKVKSSVSKEDKNAQSAVHAWQLTSFCEQSPAELPTGGGQLSLTV